MLSDPTIIKLLIVKIFSVTINSIGIINPIILFASAFFAGGGVFLLTYHIILFKKYNRGSIFSKAYTFLFDEKNQLTTLVENLPDSIYIKDSACRYILVNNNFATRLKIDEVNNLYGKSDFDFYSNKEAVRYFEEDQKILKGELPVLRREQETKKNNKLKYTITTKVPLKNKTGKIIGLIGICSDITEQKIVQLDLEKKNQELETERKLFRALMDNMPDTIYIKDKECKFLDGNLTQIQITKAGTRENLLGKSDHDFYPKDIADIFYKDDNEVINTGKPVINKEEIGFDKDGNIRVKSTTKVPFYDDKGNILGLVGIGRDITKTKEVEEKLKEQAQSLQEINVLLEERQEEINQQADELSAQNKILESERNLLRTLIDNIPDLIYIKDRNSTFVLGNRNLLEHIHANSISEIKGKSDFDYFPKDLARKYFNDEQRIIRTGKPGTSIEESTIDKDGNIMYLLTTKVPYRNADGDIIGIVGIGRDITSLKESEMKLIEQTESLQEANILLEERQEEIQQQSAELSTQNTILENERNLLRTLIDNLPDFVYVKDTESRFITANKKILEVMKAKDLVELEGKTDFDYYPKKIAQVFFDDEKQIFKSGKPLYNKLEKGFDIYGNELIISTSKVPFYDADNRLLGIVGIGKDITELKKYEERLELQADNLKEINSLLEERQKELKEKSDFVEEQNAILSSERNLLRTLIDNMPDYIYIKDIESRFLTVNKRLAEVMHAKSIDEIIGKTDFDFEAEPGTAEQYYKDDQKIIKTGKAIINKEERGFDEQDRIRVISTTKVPFFDVDGNIAGIVGIGRDITKQKNIERQLREQTTNLQEVNMLLEERQEKIQQQAEELNKQAANLRKINRQLEQLNATKNKFFSIIAHDLKNPFQAIFGFSELLMRNFEEFDDNQRIELLTMIKSSSESAYNLLENLLQWARTQTDRINYNPTHLDMKEVIEQNIKLSNASADNKNISIKVELDCDTNVFADKNMITLVLRNLISNAIKFTNNEGQIVIRCFECNKDEIAIAVSDTGIGISKDNIGKLFKIDEYFSSSGTSGETGTGLGLIICREFIEKNKGELTVDSELGIGTTFTFTLPKKEK